MTTTGLATAIIEGIILAVGEIKDETVKVKLEKKIQELREYVKTLESGIINRDQVNKELKHEIEQLRNLLKEKE